MNTAYNRRIASEVDAINHRAARHAPANFVGKGYGSDSGIDTQYRDVMGAAYNHPQNLSRVERENRAENELKYGSGFMDDLGQAFRYTPIGMVSDAAQGRDTVFSGRGYSGISGGNYLGGNYLGGNSYAKVGVTMPFREVPEAGVMDFADPLNGEGMAVSGGRRYPQHSVVQVGNSDGSGEPPKVGCAWYNTWEDFKGGRNRMMDSKKIARMTKMPEMPTDLDDDEMRFVEDLLSRSKNGAGYYGGAWYNDWDDFTAAIKEGYDAVVGVWEDYIKPVLDVIGTPVKDALISSGNPYGEAGGAFLELLGYGRGGNMALGCGDGVGGFRDDGYGNPYGEEGSGMATCEDVRTGMSGGRSGGTVGRSGGTVGRSGGRSGGNVGVFANAKPINANSLGFDPKLEVEQLNAATGSTSYGDMPTSNPVGSGMAVSGGKKRRLVKNVSGVFAAPTKMGEGYVDEDGYYVTTPRDLERHKREKYTSLDGNADADTLKNRLLQAGKDVLEVARRNAPEIAEYGRDKLLAYIGVHLPAEFRGKAEAISYLATQPFIDEWKEKIKKEVNKDKPRLGRGVLKITHGGKKVCSSDGKICAGMDDYDDPKMKGLFGMGRGGSKMEREGLAVSGDNSMGAIVAERGFSKKSQKEAAAVEDKASDNMWDGEKMENVAGRSGKKINNLILQSATRGQKGVSQGGAGYGGSHPLTQTNNLQAVYGGGGEKSGLKRKGQANAYSQLTKKIMAEKGMRLGEASAYIKANGLYKKA